MAARRPPQADVVKPPKDVEVRPPDDVSKDSILNWAAPKYDELATQKQDVLDDLTTTFNWKMSEQRLLLLAMVVMEHALWNRDGWSKKERFDAAAKALQLIKGTKASIAIEDGDEKGIPKDLATLEREKEKMAARLTTLLAKQADISGKEGKEVTDMVDKLVGEN